MSKIGELPIKIPSGVLIEVKDNQILINGAKGSLTVVKDSRVSVSINVDLVKVHVENELYGVFCGLVRSQINNAIIGVSQGYVKELEIIGVGYRVEKNGQNLKFSVGYSHPVVIEAPEGIVFDIDGNTNIKVSGINKQVVGQISALIRDIRRPEPYKGKGIKYKSEIIKRKQGKAAKGAA